MCIYIYIYISPALVATLTFVTTPLHILSVIIYLIHKHSFIRCCLLFAISLRSCITVYYLRESCAPVLRESAENKLLLLLLLSLLLQLL